MVKKLLYLASISFLVVMLSQNTVLGDDGPDHQIHRARPVELGVSGGNINDRSLRYCCSGTLGSLVKDSAGIQYVLSNNHVLARSNQASTGDEISQPGQIDQSCGQNFVVANLSDYVPIKFKKRGSAPPNKVDAAIAAVIGGEVRTDGSVLDIGTLSNNTVAAFIGQSVQKSGRTTGHTFGSVLAVDVTVDIGYSRECGGAFNQVARFVNQIRIGGSDFSDGGDSGSLIVESGNVDPVDGLPRAVGLLFAGSSSSTLANPIEPILSLLDVTMVGGVVVPPGPTGSVSGLVANADDGSAIAGASVTVDTGQSGITDANGSYNIADVPVGERSVTASAIGFASQGQAVSVSEGLDSDVNFALSPVSLPSQSVVECVIYNTNGGKNGDKHLLITIRIGDDIGNPVANAQVNIAVSLNGSAFGVGSGLTNGDGDLTFTAKNGRNGEYVTTVTDVVKGGLVFDGSTPANSFVKGTNAVPAAFCLSGSESSVTSTASAVLITSLGRAKDAKARHSKALFAISGVVGHGVGLSANGKPVIEVYMRHENSAGRARIPAALNNVPVRIVVTGPFEAF
ncbi:MAG: carboxypeptidase-like regulatory domain-containing protein [Planctomycetes bacterium]|nr:carboxypeptidase-like regulatory domain-containing protein [Planctomycetota bacterium]